MECFKSMEWINIKNRYATWLALILTEQSADQEWSDKTVYIVMAVTHLLLYEHLKSFKKGKAEEFAISYSSI